MRKKTSLQNLLFHLDDVYMIGEVTHRGGLPGLPDRVTLLAGVTFCHVNVSTWGDPPSRGRVHVSSESRPNSNLNNFLTTFGGGFVSTETLQQEQLVRIEKH